MYTIYILQGDLRRLLGHFQRKDSAMRAFSASCFFCCNVHWSCYCGVLCSRSAVYLLAFLASAYRIAESDATLPLIPVHPIGYDDAYHFLR